MKALECRLNLCFRLKVPRALADKLRLKRNEAENSQSLQTMVEQALDTEEERIFKEVAKKYYSATLEILESKLRRHANFRASVIADPEWLSLAEKYYDVLVARLRGVVQTGRVDLVYDAGIDSVVNFDRQMMVDLARRVKTDQERYWRVLGTKCRIAVAADLSYSDRFAGLIEKVGFEGFVARRSNQMMTCRNVNFLYLPVSCDKMVVFLENDVFMRELKRRAEDETLADGTLLSVDSFAKEIEIECLKGGVVTLILDAEELQIDAETPDGTSNFVRELIERWLSNGLNTFISMAKVCESELPVTELMDDLSGEFDGIKEMIVIRKKLADIESQIVESEDIERSGAGSVLEVESEVKVRAGGADKLKEKKQESKDSNRATNTSISDSVAVKRVKKNISSDEVTSDDTVKINFVKNIKGPVSKKQPVSEKQVAVSAVKKSPLRVKARQDSGAACTPRPIKEPGFALKTKMMDEAQRQVQREPEPEIFKELRESSSDGGRDELDFDVLWGFSDESVAGEGSNSEKSKIPAIGSIDGRFRGLVAQDASGGDIGKFDYDEAEPIKVVRQIGFAAIKEGGLGEIYDRSDEKVA